MGEMNFDVSLAFLSPFSETLPIASASYRRVEGLFNETLQLGVTNTK